MVKKNFRFFKKVFVAAMSFFGYNALKCVSMNNQECKVRTGIININSNNPSTVIILQISKYSGSCNNINNPYPRVCVADVCKNMNVKSNLISFKLI